MQIENLCAFTVKQDGWNFIWSKFNLPENSSSPPVLPSHMKGNGDDKNNSANNKQQPVMQNNSN